MLQVIELYLKRHENYLDYLLNEANIPASQIKQAMHYALFPGGKRIRPILVYLTGQVLEVPIEVLDVIAASIELTHCYSLIHDDLPAMDDDDFRRGKASCHKAFDEATAILVGDGMQALAIETLLFHLPALLNPLQVNHIALELVKASGISGMVSGQSLDLSELAKSTVNEDVLLQIHRLKTGTLISACIEMVLAAAAPLPEDYKAALRSYAQILGLVFQMQDDYLDHYATDDVLGKGRSSDKANQKTTFATLMPRNKLESEISQHYQNALQGLDVFKDKANDLIALTRQLEARTKI